MGSTLSQITHFTLIVRTSFEIKIICTKGYVKKLLIKRFLVNMSWRLTALDNIALTKNFDNLVYHVF